MTAEDFVFAPASDDDAPLGDRDSVDGDGRYHVKKRRLETLYMLTLFSFQSCCESGIDCVRSAAISLLLRLELSRRRMTRLRGHIRGQGRSYADFMNAEVFSAQTFWDVFRMTREIARKVVERLRLPELPLDDSGCRCTIVCDARTRQRSTSSILWWTSTG